MLPALGTLKLATRTQEHVRRFYRSIARSERTEKRKDTDTANQTRRATANRCLAVLSSFLQWAVEEDEIKVNPARGIKRVKKGVEKADTRTLSLAEARRFLQACETLRAKGG